LPFNASSISNCSSSEKKSDAVSSSTNDLDCDNKGEVSDEDDASPSPSSTDHHHHHHHNSRKASIKRIPICKELSDLISLIRIRLADLNEVQSQRKFK